MVMVFIVSLDVMQYLQGFFLGGGLHLYFLETTLQGTILLDGVAILIQRRGSYALYGTPGQGRLQDVGSIHGTGGSPGTYHGVYLINEDDDVGVLLQLLDEHLHAFLKLSAVLGTCHHTRHVERDQTLVEEHGRTVA